MFNRGLREMLEAFDEEYQQWHTLRQQPALVESRAWQISNRYGPPLSNLFSTIRIIVFYSAPHSVNDLRRVGPIDTSIPPEERYADLQNRFRMMREARVTIDGILGILSEIRANDGRLTAPPIQ